MTEVSGVEGLLEAHAPWFEDGSAHAGVDGAVSLFTTCLVPASAAETSAGSARIGA